MNIDLYCGDCLEILPKLIMENKLVDTIITDIPYGTTQCSWDSIIPFDMMWGLLHKICPNGPIVLFAKQFVQILYSDEFLPIIGMIEWMMLGMFFALIYSPLLLRLPMSV